MPEKRRKFDAEFLEGAVRLVCVPGQDLRIPEGDAGIEGVGDPGMIDLRRKDAARERSDAGVE